jgi:hypothetical protein
VLEVLDVDETEEGAGGNWLWGVLWKVDDERLGDCKRMTDAGAR